VSATAFHYDKNLNFFSFATAAISPQQYLLASVPISCENRGALCL